MKKTNLLSWVCLLCVLISVLMPTVSAAEAPAGKSTAIYLADADSGYVYYERNANNKVYPASLTKIMTAMLAVEAIEQGEVSLDDMVTAQVGFDFDMEADGSTSGIVLGETMTLKDLLYCTLMASANEACNIVGMYISGDVASFVELMNRRAGELGCKNTHFANTHGLPNENHYTTAYDMFLITRQAMEYDLFATICDTAEYTVQPTNKSDVRALLNTNGLINPNSEMYKGYYYEPAMGVKTGHTNAAGYCLISAAEKDGIRMYCVVMGGVMTEDANGVIDHSSFSDTIALYDWVFENYTRIDLVKAEELITEVPVTLGSDADSIPLRAQTPISAVIANDADLSQLKKTLTIYGEEGSCQAPIDEGQVLGEMTVSLNGVEYGSTYLVANRSVDLSYLQSMGAAIRNTLKNTWVRLGLFLVLAVVIGYAVLVIRYRITYRKRQKELQQARLQRQQMQEQAQRERMFADAKRQSYRSRSGEQTPPPSDVTRDYFEEFFRDDK